jgi:gliding motility-associated-like protein
MGLAKKFIGGFAAILLGLLSNSSAQSLQIEYDDTLNCSLDSNHFYSHEIAKSHYWHPLETWTQDSNFLKNPIPKFDYIEYDGGSEQFAVAEDSGDIFIFLSYPCHGLFRYKYNKSFNSKPQITYLGYLDRKLLGCVSSVHVFKENNEWFGLAFIAGTNFRSRIVRLEFGNSLNNTPVADEIMIYNGGQLSNQIYFNRINGTLFGYAVDRFTNGFTQINFGNSIRNTPTFKIIKVPYKRSQFRAFTMGMDASGNHWILAPTINSGNFILVKFGKDPLNTNPVIDSIGMFGIGGGDYLGITSYTVNGKTFVWLNNANNRQNFFYFGNGIYKPPTVVKPLGNPYNPIIWEYGYMSPCFRFNDSLYSLFISNYDGLILMKYSTNTEAYHQSLNANFHDRNSTQLSLKYQKNIPNMEQKVLRYVINEGQSDQRDTLISVTIKPCPENPSCGFWVPNAFSPDNNGINDQFGFNSDCLINSIELLIYDRWGQLIHRSKGENPTWNGEIDGEECPEGVYAYIFNFDYNYTSEKRQQYGTFKLLRYNTP